MQESNIRPWGRYDILLDANETKVKLITVNPSSKLSYQYHEKRKEQWVVVEGQLTLILNDVELVLNPGMTVAIYPGDKHRAWNKTDKVVKFVEVQTGSYFGEDDIIRLEDDYGRAN